MSLFLDPVFSAFPPHFNEHAIPFALTLASDNLFFPLSVLYETEGEGHLAGTLNTKIHTKRLEKAEWKCIEGFNLAGFVFPMEYEFVRRVDWCRLITRVFWSLR